jgi:sarcosine oxidase
MTRTVVVGGGVAGSSAAWHLARRGHDVTLLEQHGAGHDRGSSHGSSRIFRLAYPESLYVGLAVRALPWWRQLEAETGRPVLTLTGMVDHGPAAATRDLAAALAAAGQEHELLPAAAVEERWPGLRVDGTALFHPAGGRLHADDAVAALRQAATAQGADVRHHTKMDRLSVRPDGVEAVTAAGEAVAADVAVVAAGGWAPAFLSTLDIPAPPLRVTQEQPAHFPAADPLGWPSFLHHGGAGLPAGTDAYGLGSVDGVKVGFHGVGPTVTDPDGRDRRVDAAAQRRLQEYAATWLPGVDASAPDSFTCLYTMTPDHDFVIDRHGPVVVLGGFSGHGFKFGSVLGELAADLVDGGSPVARFALTPPR